MKVKSMLIGVCLVVFTGCFFVNSSYSQSTPKNHTTKQKIVQYTCPMHPQVVSDKPGKCPICGMALVVKNDNRNKNMKQDSTWMKKDSLKTWRDSTNMDNRRLKRDTSNMRRLKVDTTTVKRRYP